MRFAVGAVTLAVASILLGAVLEKVRHLPSFVATLRDLGIRRGATAAAVAAAAMELLVSFAILFGPDPRIAAGGVLALALSFLIAGLVALRRPGTIRCRCFGAEGDGTLGKSQILAFPFWLAAAALLGSQPPLPVAWQSALFAAAGLTLAAVRGRAALHAALQARGDRRSAKEMYVWLR